MRPDYYAILKIPLGATPEKIRAAYRRLARQHHLDAGGSSEGFRTIQEAYEVLSDAARRREYDAQRRAAAPRSAKASPPGPSGSQFSQRVPRPGSGEPLEPLIPPQPAEALAPRDSGSPLRHERDPLSDFDRLFREFDEFFENLEKQFLETYWGRSD